MNIICKHLILPSYWAKKIIVILLCNLHALTRYKVARSFTDLFYAPEGFCFHTVVVIACLAALLWSLYDDAVMEWELIEDLVKTVKEGLE
ncbi:MAG: hypothetical protein IKY23_12365 [Lachnospiraceae bacterium]|nr:hypothetical protein [Lachnospiraceae bacterium]